MRAVLSNAKHPEYGQVTIPFPLAQDQYDDCVELLEKLGIGDVVERDCKVDEIQDGLPILKRLEKAAINIDELDYLTKRLDSFDYIEAAQFQAMAVKTGIFDINLDDYERVPEDASEYGEEVLHRLGADDEVLDAIDGYMDFAAFGEAQMQEDGVRRTEFGLIRRCSSPFPEQGHGLVMS